jgi:hypothetical protein
MNWHVAERSRRLEELHLFATHSRFNKALQKMAASERQLAITGLRVALNHYGAATLAADSTRQSRFL